MKLEIDSETRIEEVQEKFTEVYPYLKVDFYKRQHGEEELSAVKDMISPEKLFSSEDKFSKPGNIDISKHCTVAVFEKESRTLAIPLSLGI